MQVVRLSVFVCAGLAASWLSPHALTNPAVGRHRAPVGVFAYRTEAIFVDANPRMRYHWSNLWWLECSVRQRPARWGRALAFRRCEVRPIPFGLDNRLRPNSAIHLLSIAQSRFADGGGQRAAACHRCQVAKDTPHSTAASRGGATVSRWPAANHRLCESLMSCFHPLFGQTFGLAFSAHRKSQQPAEKARFGMTRSRRIRIVSVVGMMSASGGG